MRDDGIGLPPDADRTSPETLGLRLVGALSDQLHAQLSLENRSGACITLVFHAQCAAKRDPAHAVAALDRQPPGSGAKPAPAPGPTPEGVPVSAPE